MDYGTLTFFNPDSYMSRRGNARQVFGEEYRKSSSLTNTTSPCTPVPSRSTPNRRNQLPAGSKSYQYTASPAASFDSDLTNPSFGDIFTAVLSSKLAKQPIPKSVHLPSPQQVESPFPSKPMRPKRSMERKVPPAQTFLEPLTLLCRVRGDRERQLDTRCLRIIRKLSVYSEYQEIVRRFASAESEVDPDSALMTSCANKARLRVSCGVRAYIMKFLRLKEPRNSLAVSQATLLLSGDSTPEHSCVRDANGSPHRYDARRMSRNSMTLEQSSELEESLTLERSPKVANGSSGSTTSGGHLPPETLLRRLARSISTRLAYKRCLHEQATQRLSDLDKETDVVRNVLRKITEEALPQMRNEADVCYLHIPPTVPADVVEMKVCQETSSAYPTASSCHLQPMLSSSPELPEITANLLPRFDRLLSSQVAVLELLNQLIRRLYCLDRRIAECIATVNDAVVNSPGDTHKSCEMDAILFSLQSRRQQLMNQIGEAQRLRDDFESTKARLLSGVQYQFFVLRDTLGHPERNKSDENYSSPSEVQECYDSSGQSSPSTPQRSEVDSVICLAEFLSRHLGAYLQALLIKLCLETEIFDDQEAVDCVGEHLRLVSSFSP